ncbi:TetR/AcrR family transcriptional regulator [Lentibacillus halophilus]|uniref:TetR/AcrR family transcriptional regulator n=1 Tax=Lentibacillus halophilus TaxID=295065 RepID=A0ABP3J1X0_9BACI
MSTKKQEIKDMAIHLFAEKGYYVTSVQEIAQTCNVSKGAFYKHFDSKENLLIEIIKDHHESLFKKAHSVQYSDALSATEVLQKRITIELEEMQKSSSIFFIVLNEYSPNDQSEVADMMENFRLELMEWHKQWLLEAFGEKNHSIIWDLVVIYEGIMKEYTSLFIFRGITLSINHLANLITSVLEEAGNSMRMMHPILTKEKLFKPMNEEEKVSLKSKMNQQLSQMKLLVKSLSLQENEKDKFTQTVNHLTKEVSMAEPKMYLIEALINYLKSEEALRTSAIRLEQTINNHLRGKGEHAW